MALSFQTGVVTGGAANLVVKLDSDSSLVTLYSTPIGYPQTQPGVRVRILVDSATPTFGAFVSLVSPA